MPISCECLRNKPDYGENESHPQDYSDDDLLELSQTLAFIAAELVNPYLNTPPTELARKLKSEKNKAKRSLMTKALNAWRMTNPGPFRSKGV